jgi:opacity protein-like surface antigen
MTGSGDRVAVGELPIMNVLRRLVVGWCVCASLACLQARAEDLGPPIDLTAFDAPAAGAASVWDDVPLEPVGLRGADLDGPERRFYVSGMLGPSFLSLVTAEGPFSATTHDAPLAAGGAVGVAFERANGRLRIETEGMGRATSFGPLATMPPLTVGFQTASNWSVTENVWRDVMLTDRLGLYGGGGIGAGGYRFGIGARAPGGSASLYAPAAAAFAWQAGGGVIYEVTERLTFDISYRYFQIESITQPATSSGPFAGVSSIYGASELMFGLRLYEPFQRWRR